MRLGPVLSFRDAVGGIWRVSIMAADNAAIPAMSAVGAMVNAPQVIGTADGATVWRWDLALQQTAVAQSVTYPIGAITAMFTVPAIGAPLRQAYVSCNGFSSKKLADTTADPFGLWRQIGTQHVVQAFHLLLMGGDQVYADAVFDLPASRR